MWRKVLCSAVLVFEKNVVQFLGDRVFDNKFAGAKVSQIFEIGVTDFQQKIQITLNPFEFMPPQRAARDFQLKF